MGPGPQRPAPSLAGRIALIVVGLLGLNLAVTGAATVACAIKHLRDTNAQCNVELEACQKAAAQIGTVGMAMLGMGIFTKPSSSTPDADGTLRDGNGEDRAAPVAAPP